MSRRAVILGCGSSAGVPRAGQGWGACDPNEPRNRRRRCSLLIEAGASPALTSVVIDTGPDLRAQMLDADVRRIDGVLYTHSHADHTHGVDDLRPFVIQWRKRIDLYLDETTEDHLLKRFEYIFRTPPGSGYPPLANAHRLRHGVTTRIDGAGGPVEATPFRLDHGDMESLGFRIGALAYTPDVVRIPEESEPLLRDLDVWIIDALRYTPHPTHFSVDEALGWIARMKPRRAILTNLHTDLDYRTLVAKMPAGVEVAYDGMAIAFD